MGAERPCGHLWSDARSAGIDGNNAASKACLLKGEYRRARVRVDKKELVEMQASRKKECGRFHSGG